MHRPFTNTFWIVANLTIIIAGFVIYWLCTLDVFELDYGWEERHNRSALLGTLMLYCLLLFLSSKVPEPKNRKSHYMSLAFGFAVVLTAQLTKLELHY